MDFALEMSLEMLNKNIDDDAPEIVYLHALEIAIVALSKCPEATSESVADSVLKFLAAHTLTGLSGPLAVKDRKHILWTYTIPNGGF